MTRRVLWIAIPHLLLLAGCDEPPTGPAERREEAAPPPASGELVPDRLAPPADDLRSLYARAERSELGDGIAHYRFEVRLGAGPFDVVRIHRVVRERRPYHPVRADGAVFMTHGASLTFEAIYLRPGVQEADSRTSVAVYLAGKGLDVWGMDFAWTLVPEETDDFSFMRGWGVERDVDHTLAAMSIARLIRGATGQGLGRLHLLGFSYSVGVAYAAAGRETQQHRIARDIAGLIAVDGSLKYAAADESSRLAACNSAAAIRAQLAAGTYQNAGGRTFGVLSRLATTSPDGPSPAFAGLTNHQAALFVGANTFALGNPAAPHWHFVAGAYDAAGTPVGLLHTQPARWIALLRSLPPYMPQQAQLDNRTSSCDEEEVSIDDHLAEISVPILYLGAGGATGTLGEHTTGLTASRDITLHTVSLEPEGRRAVDFGHADLFLAENAPTLVWEPLRDWLVRGTAPRP